VIAAINGDWHTFGQKLREAWDVAWNSIISVLATAGLKLSNMVAGLVDAIRKKFSDTDWGQVGKNIIEGIAQGVIAASNFLAEAAENAAKAALEAAKGFLGIHSPSAVFAEVGESVAAGFAQGINMNAEMPALAVGDMAGRTLAAGAGASAAGGGPVNISVSVPVSATMSGQLDAEQWAWRISEIIGSELQSQLRAAGINA